jgi:phosphatidylserine decarboxylase
MCIRPEVIPFVWAAVIAGTSVGLGAFVKTRRPARAAINGLLLAMVLACYFLYFFRDPQRTPPSDPLSIVAGADGRIAQVVEMPETKYLKTDTIRISIFLSLIDVHVNRAPLSGRARFLGYFPGKRLFTFQEKSSEVNQHNAILIEGAGTRCLVKQIVGPVARRVVYWPDHDKEVYIEKGARIGMMKFGSRLDMYLPAADVTVVAKVGDKVTAGETVVATLREVKAP